MRFSTITALTVLLATGCATSSTEDLAGTWSGTWEDASAERKGDVEVVLQVDKDDGIAGLEFEIFDAVGNPPPVVMEGSFTPELVDVASVQPKGTATWDSDGTLSIELEMPPILDAIQSSGTTTEIVGEVKEDNRLEAVFLQFDREGAVMTETEWILIR